MKLVWNKSKLQPVLIGTLSVLLPLLAILQYVWLDRLSEGERLRLEAQVQRAGGRFAEAFARDFTQARAIFQIPVYDAATDPQQALRYGFQQWNMIASMPDLIQSIHWVEATRLGELNLHRYDAELGILVQDEWGAELSALKDRLKQQIDIGHGRAYLTTDVVDFDDSPVLVIPQISILQSLAKSSMQTFHFVLLSMDTDYIKNTYIPELAKKHLEDDTGTLFEFAVRKSGPLPEPFYKSNDALEGSFFEQPDARVSLQSDAVSGSMMQLSVFVDSSGQNINSDLMDRLISSRNKLRLELRTSSHSTYSFETSEQRTTVPGWDSLGIRNDLAYQIMPDPDSITLGQVVIRRNLGRDVDVLGFDPSKNPQGSDPSAATRAEWELVLTHQAGSIEAAVMREKWKNLALGYGIMLVLTASISTLIIGTRRAQRLAQQQIEFVAGVSHELRTPLAVIRSAGENLADGVVRDPSQMQQYGKLIRDEGRRLTLMVEQSMELAGIQSGQRTYHLRPIEVLGVLEQACASSQLLFEKKNINLKTSWPDHLPEVLGDAAALQSAIENILHNAAKYSQPQQSVRVDATQVNDWLQISVQDQGIGIEEGDLTQIFKPFFRGERARMEQYEGSGIGLSLVQHVMEAHHGRVIVHSEPGKGSTFLLQLPILTDEQTHLIG